MTTQTSIPSPSQYASAACHLERMADWRYVRIAGDRYAVIPSGISGHTYLCRAAADGCSCLGYLKTGRRCSHMLAIELSALEQELIESRPAPRQTIEAIWPSCAAAGCSDDPEPRGEGYCHRHQLVDAF